MKKLARLAAALVVVGSLAGITAAPALADGDDPAPQGTCIKMPKTYCAF